MDLSFPYDFDCKGRTARPSDEEHIRQLIEQVLFTSPGERVNHPTFGSGLLQLVFAPIDDALNGALQMSVQGALQQWLGDLIQVEAVLVESEDTTVNVTVRYKVIVTQQQSTAHFSRSL